MCGALSYFQLILFIFEWNVLVSSDMINQMWLWDLRLGYPTRKYPREFTSLLLLLLVAAAVACCFVVVVMESLIRCGFEVSVLQ